MVDTLSVGKWLNVFYLIIILADGIKCFSCVGTEDECAKNELEADKAKYLTTCPSSMDRCMRTWAKKDDITALATSCATKAGCDAAKNVCDNFKDGQCTVSCCDTDECNGSPSKRKNHMFLTE